jgi:hypothetical protein
MALWTLDILPLAGGAPTVTGAKFQTARITWALDGTGSCEIGLTKAQAATGNWLWGQRRLRFKDGAGTARYQGWLDRLERAGSPSLEQYRVASRGLAAILDQRAVHGDFSQVGVVATTIATNLLNHIDTQTDDMTNFTVGTITGVAPARNRYYCDGDIIKSLIDELANLDSGFAWEISATGAFNAWVGGRGSDLSASVVLAPSGSIDWQCAADVTELGTYVTAIGDRDDDEPCGAVLVVDSGNHKTLYGRREFVISSSTRNLTELGELTDEEIRSRGAGRINLRTSWMEGRGPWAFGAVWLGDIVDAALGAEFGGNLDMRLISVTVNLEQGVHEFCEYEWEAAS